LYGTQSPKIVKHPSLNSSTCSSSRGIINKAGVARHDIEASMLLSLQCGNSRTLKKRSHSSASIPFDSHNWQLDLIPRTRTLSYKCYTRQKLHTERQAGRW